MKKCDKNNGITLIALVVTIIVLLILAGISINMLTGQNGILNRAQEAKEKTEEAQKDEANKIATMELMVQSAGIKVTNPSIYGENPNAQATADGAGKYFALPTGAKYIEGTVDTGVVVNIKGSEFVWVPVEDVVLDKSRDNELPKSGSVVTSSEKIYTPMAVNVGNDYKGILYDFSTNNGYLKYASDENYQGSSTGFREPDTISDFDGGIHDTVDGKIMATNLTSEYNLMIESVLKYKGFYVARYEASLDKTTGEIVFKNASIESNNTIITNAGKSETNLWYGLYKKIKTFTTDEDKVVSSMIWGSQYDAMMNWMVKTGNSIAIRDDLKTNPESVTGTNKNDIINNVYDLYGCHREWTLEASNSNSRVYRGGSFEANVFPAYRDSMSPISPSSSTSSRATLYIK